MGELLYVAEVVRLQDIAPFDALMGAAGYKRD